MGSRWTFIRQARSIPSSPRRNCWIRVSSLIPSGCPPARRMQMIWSLRWTRHLKRSISMNQLYIYRAHFEPGILLRLEWEEYGMQSKSMCDFKVRFKKRRCRDHSLGKSIVEVYYKKYGCANFYNKDAMQSVCYAERLLNGKKASKIAMPVLKEWWPQYNNFMNHFSIVSIRSNWEVNF